VLVSAEDLRAELDARAAHVTGSDLVVVVPELSSLGQHAARFALLASRGAGLGVRFVVGSSDPEQAVGDPLTTHFATRMVLRMQTEEASVALLGVADAAFLGGGGRLLLRVDGRQAVELYGYQVAAEHLERLVKVMRSAYSPPGAGRGEPPESSHPSIDGSPSGDLAPPSAQPADTPLASPQVEPDQTSEVDPADDRPAVAADAEARACNAPIQVYCFGSPRVECAGQIVWPRSGGDAKPWELLLFLAAAPVEGVTKDRLVNSLWPQDELVEDLGHRLRQLRFRLRRQLQQLPGAPQVDGIYLERHMLRMDPGLVHSDAQEFQSLVHSVRVNPGEDAIERLEQARALYVGDLLTGPDVRRYAWLDERDDSGVTLREHFRRLFQNASARLAELYAQANQLDDAIEVYRELTVIDPADERHWQALFRLHARHDDRPALIAEEQRLRQTLRDLAEELDIAGGADEPGEEITREYQRLLAGLREPEPAAV
jgi:two-component SAPR family response regulator